MVITGIPKDLLRKYRQLIQERMAQYQTNQAQMQQSLPSGWANALGGALGGMGLGMPQSMQQTYQPVDNPVLYQMLMGRQQDRMTVRFNRINEIVEVSELDTLAEPLDELRIKVAKWLYN